MKIIKIMLWLVVLVLMILTFLSQYLEWNKILVGSLFGITLLFILINILLNILWKKRGKE